MADETSAGIAEKRRDKMQKRYPVTRVGDEWGEIARHIERGTVVELTDGGSPVAVVLSLQSYRALTAGKPDFKTLYDELRREFDLPSLEITPDVFPGSRETGPERGFSW
jgi:hypothetical protein